jgi:hypothetical protein
LLRKGLAHTLFTAERITGVAESACFKTQHQLTISQFLSVDVEASAGILREYSPFRAFDG